ncbi:MAG: hypothetical protein K2M15_07570 [Oscillospiraceae bacterium]|nr:hypothetical protein [Oscillospiraceae bacterium]
MQQTEKHKLNLIESSDTFSPAPLNENTQKIEDALSAETVRRIAADAALDSRVTALEVHKVAVGTYTGNGVADGQEINLGFAPSIVFVQDRYTGAVIATKARTYYGSLIVLTENGFRAANDLIGNRGMNGGGGIYTYCAIA